jgi:hypothetical protein
MSGISLLLKRISFSLDKVPVPDGIGIFCIFQVKKFIFGVAVAEAREGCNLKANTCAGNICQTFS